MNRRETLKLAAAAAAVTTLSGFPKGLSGARAQQKTPAFALPPLGYSYEALEPHIDTATMTIHHKNHHQAYVNALNGLVEKYPDLAKRPIESILSDINSVPADVRTGVRNNLGGHWNHTYFWELMRPGGARTPTADVKSAVEAAFGDVDKMMVAVTQAGLTRFGSGWAWLVVDKNKKLSAVNTPYQDTPHMELGAKPLLGVDVWEHAYYLKHQSRRAEYIKAWWNTVNWDKVAENFKKATT